MQGYETFEHIIPMKKQLIYGASLALISLAMAGCTGKNSSAENQDKPQVEIVNSYDNTDELLQKFPVVYPTSLQSKLEKDIQNRLLTGFENWNRGYEAWKAWGDILYTKDSYYNVHGARLTLAEYQSSMDATLKKINIQMGQFKNMVIVDNWVGIQYEISTNGKPGTTMEFVQFKDYGGDLGVRVVEGWGGARDDTYSSMRYFQNPEEQAQDSIFWESVKNYTLPETKDLTQKYMVKYPTTLSGEQAEKMKEAILQDFEQYNQGYDAWSTWADQLYAKDLNYNTKRESLTLETLKKSTKESFGKIRTTKLYFDSMLIRDDWAAIHYRVVEEDLATGEKTPDDRMEFLHFRNENGKWVVFEVFAS